MISAYYTIDSILIAVGITTFVCLGVTIFSFQTKYDFTSCFGVLFVISLALLGFGIVCIFVRSNVRISLVLSKDFLDENSLDSLYGLCWSWSCGFFNRKWCLFSLVKEEIVWLVFGCGHSIDHGRKTTWNQCWRSYLCINHALSRCCLYIHLHSSISWSTRITKFVQKKTIFYSILDALFLFLFLSYIDPFLFLSNIWEVSISIHLIMLENETNLLIDVYMSL